MASRPRRAAHGGFTLLEILVALSIIATALVALLSLHGRNLNTVADDQRILRATLLAQDFLTQLLIDEPFPDPGEEPNACEGETEFRCHLLVLEGPGTIEGVEASEEIKEGLREIQVRVYWDENDLETVKVVTHVRNPEG